MKNERKSLTCNILAVMVVTVAIMTFIACSGNRKSTTGVEDTSDSVDAETNAAEAEVLTEPDISPHPAEQGADMNLPTAVQAADLITSSPAQEADSKPQELSSQTPTPELSDLERLKQKAEQGDARSQFDLGVCYHNGSGVSQSTEEAVKWIRKSAEQGFADAQYAMAECYVNGDGVAQNPTKAARWYRKAAEQGYADAQHNLGVCYQNGYGVTTDNTEAAKWYRKAAEQGNVNAQYNLGICYSFGLGVTQSPEEAFKWWRKAADQGFAAAQYNVGLCYGNGIGVAKDVDEAMNWFRKAARQGNTDAIEILGKLGETAN